MVKRRSEQPRGMAKRTDTPEAEQASEQDDAERAEAPEEAHGIVRARSSGTLADATDLDQLPVHEPGMSVDPEELGAQFLRDATEQDNFESSLRERGALDDVPLGSVISEGTLSAAGQEDIAVPGSTAFEGSGLDESALEPSTEELDLVDRVVEQGSLFDQPTADGEVVSPAIDADESVERRAEPFDEEEPDTEREEWPRDEAQTAEDDEEDLTGARELDPSTRVTRAVRRRPRRPLARP